MPPENFGLRRDAAPRQVRSLAVAALTGGEGAGRAAEARELTAPTVVEVRLLADAVARELPVFSRGLETKVRQARLLDEAPGVRPLGKLPMEVATEGWRFPVGQSVFLKQIRAEEPAREPAPPPPVSPFEEVPAEDPAKKEPKRTRPRPPADAVTLKERLLYLLQPPIETVFGNRQIHLPFAPFPYQREGIAFLMPRYSALLADEMGLGKTAQVILASRLLFHAGLIHKALIVCPKPLVHNWSRELKTWAEDVPFEVIDGDWNARRIAWHVSNCPLKLVNYELLTRDADFLQDEKCHFDLVILDEAQRIKNHDSKTALVVRSIKRQRSWALSGTPIENRPEDLINLFAFIKPGHVPPDTPAKKLSELTADCILRRVKEDVLTDMPPKFIHDTFIDLTQAQRDSYQLAEKEGVVRLNSMGETVTVQHVFELVMRLKQICNFDPFSGESAKLEVLLADMAEIAANGRKAIIFSQWVEPLEMLARHLREFGPLLFHGKIPSKERNETLAQFKQDPDKHVILMSYATGSVGLNLQFTNYVFLFDRWWNPAIEDQAINRAHRVGQKEPVYVKRFVAQGTIEGRICEVLNQKRQLFEEIIGQNGPPTSLGLTEDDIFGLFDLRVRPRRAG